MSADSPLQLPNELNLSPHLSAHKYFLVCTLTVAAWDTLVLSPRTWRLLKMPGWPALKIIFHFLRFWMPAEFIVVAVAFFDTKWSQQQCNTFYLFEPIMTAILLAATSVVHVIRIHAIYESNRGILLVMGTLFAVQIVVTAVSCGFYRSVPLLEGQGCIAGPRHTWVGIYWIAPTVLYITSFFLALRRSLTSLTQRPLSLWKLMLRDGLNLYFSIALIHLINAIFWFAAQPTDTADTIRTIVTSMAAVLTTSMTLRIILSVRGTLAHGGSFALSASSGGGQSSSRTTHVLSAGANTGINTGIGAGTRSVVVGGNGTGHGTFTLDEMRGKPEAWVADGGSADGEDGKSSVRRMAMGMGGEGEEEVLGGGGVKVTIDRDVGYDENERYRK